MFSVQCLLLGLQGYLIPFAPLAFIPYCQIRAGKMPSLLLVQTGSTHLTGPPTVLLTSTGPKPDSISCSSTLKRPDFTGDLSSKLRMF